MTQEIKYIHDPKDHNPEAPNEIVPLLLEVFMPGSVVDYGCGLGHFLQAFEQGGVKNLQGYDGGWVDQKQLFISADRFEARDLEQPLIAERRYDLVLCLEVAEHLSAEAADVLIDNLISLGDKIIFSAAVPNQGGQFHLNEQPVSYWVDKFKDKGFVFHDVFRERFWNNAKINWWYKQNMFLVMHESIDPGQFVFPGYDGRIRQYIHPELLAVHAQNAFDLKQKIRAIKTGRLSLRFYLQLFKTKIAGKFTGTKKELL